MLPQPGGGGVLVLTCGRFAEAIVDAFSRGWPFTAGATPESHMLMKRARSQTPVPSPPAGRIMAWSSPPIIESSAVNDQPSLFPDRVKFHLCATTAPTGGFSGSIEECVIPRGAMRFFWMKA